MRPIITALAIMLGITALATTAQALDAPAQCDTAREARFFDLGVRKGRNLADAAIARVEEDTPDLCHDQPAIDDLRALIQTIVDGIVTPVSASEVVQCHVLGQIAGLLAEIADLQDDCDDLCIADGEFIGEIAAQLYCALSIALDGLSLTELFERLATDSCGVNFQVACDSKFEEVSTDDPLCLPFTEGAFTPVYLQTQNNQCAFEPAPPP